MQPAEQAPPGLGFPRKRRGQWFALRHRAAPFQEPPKSGAEFSSTLRLPWLLHSARLCPLTGTVSLCSREEHLWDDKPACPGEDGVDHPSDCGISLDLRVPHPSHCRAHLLEVSHQAALAWARVPPSARAQRRGLDQGDGARMASSLRRVRWPQCILCHHLGDPLCCKKLAMQSLCRD